MKLNKFLKIGSFISALMVAGFVQASETVKLDNVHLCCNSCVKGVDKAISKVDGVTAACDKEASSLVLTAPDKAAAQKAVDALVKAGYYGKSEDASIKLSAKTGAKGAKVEKLSVSNVHLCCDKCVKAVVKALDSVEGVKGNTAAKNAETFEVTGSFNDKDVFTALHKAGLTGNVAK